MLGPTAPTSHPRGGPGRPPAPTAGTVERAGTVATALHLALAHRTVGNVERRWRGGASPAPAAARATIALERLRATWPRAAPPRCRAARRGCTWRAVALGRCVAAGQPFASWTRRRAELLHDAASANCAIRTAPPCSSCDRAGVGAGRPPPGAADGRVAAGTPGRRAGAPAAGGRRLPRLHRRACATGTAPSDPAPGDVPSPGRPHTGTSGSRGYVLCHVDLAEGAVVLRTSHPAPPRRAGAVGIDGVPLPGGGAMSFLAEMLWRGLQRIGSDNAALIETTERTLLLAFSSTAIALAVGPPLGYLLGHRLPAAARPHRGQRRAGPAARRPRRLPRAAAPAPVRPGPPAVDVHPPGGRLAQTCWRSRS